LVHEYDRILTPLNALRLDYQEAKLHAERRQWERAEALFGRVLASGEEAPSSLRFQALFRLGLLFAEQQAWSRATRSLTQALELARAEPEINLPVHRVLYEMARICRASGSLGDTALLLEECIKWAELLNAGCDLALAHNALGEVHHQLGQQHQALAEYRKCLSVLEDCHELEDKVLCAQVYNNLGVTCADLKAWFESACYFKSSLIVARQAGDLLGQATALNNLMHLKQELGHHSQDPQPCLLPCLDEE
jgi:tetratricopeptide (TPR) repeat protein